MTRTIRSQRRIFSEEELKSFAPFIVDAYREFRWASESMLQIGKGMRQSPFAFHATIIGFRCFLDFFCKMERSSNPRVKDEDVLAADFSPSWQCKFSSSWLEEERRECTKMLAHLSFTRSTLSQADKDHWNVNRIMAIHQLWKHFLGQLPAERRAWFAVENDESGRIVEKIA